MTDTQSTLRDLLVAGELDLPAPGTGRTDERHLRLFELARRHPVAIGRLAEAHADAVAILHEAGRTAQPGALYGVWASVAPSSEAPPLRGELRSNGADTVTLTAVKPFASGLGIVDRALVTATCDAIEPPGHTRDRLSSSVLVDVDLRRCSNDTIEMETGRWSTDALRETATGQVRFCEHVLPGDCIVGSPNWYLERPGFWHGACGPASCWAGAAAGLVDEAERLTDDDPHRRAHLGAMRSHLWALEAVITAAGRQIDADPLDAVVAQRRARALRHTVERTANDILDRFGRSLGPRPFVGDADIRQRWVDTHLYLRQDHAERDLVVLGSPQDPT